MCRKMGSLAGTATIVMLNRWVALRLGVPESCRITTTLECVHSKGYKSIVQHRSLINCYRKSTWGVYIEVVRYSMTVQVIIHSIIDMSVVLQSSQDHTYWFTDC